MHILPLLSRSYSDFGMVFCHCNATFLQIISSLSSLARSFCHITKPISVRLQQTENKSVCNFVVPCRKPCKTKRRFAKIKRRFSTTKRRFVGPKRRFAESLFWAAKTDCSKAVFKGRFAREKLGVFAAFVGFFCTFAAQNFTKWQRT